MLCILAAVPSSARAQIPPPAATAPTAPPAATATPPASTAPAPAKAPPDPALPFAIRFYGTLQAVAVLSDGVQSFAFPNPSAITAAANPALLRDPDAPYLSFQVQQSRVGVMIGEGSPVKANVEIDFVHFDTASPTVAAFPRLRIALLEWTPREGHRLFIGQTWDLFSPLNSHSVNLVGSLFQAGNAGFMRHQLGWVGRFGGVEIALAVGFQGNNAGPTFGNLERSAIPTGAARVSYWMGKKLWVGLAALGTGLRLTRGEASETRPAFGLNAFALVSIGGFDLRAEAYAGQNLANLSTLALSQGRFGQSVRDIGGYVSAKQTWGAHAVYAMAGAATVLDDAAVVPGYTPGDAMSGTVGAPATANGPGIEWNTSLHAGYAYAIWKGLSVVAEPFVYYTRHKLAESDAALDPTRLAFGAEVGAMFVF